MHDTALKGRYDTYYVNGNWKIQLPGQVDVEGTKVIYDRKGTWERLIAKGPTTEPMHVMVREMAFLRSTIKKNSDEVTYVLVHTIIIKGLF